MTRPRRSVPGKSRTSAGFTLIELVAVMAIFSLVAVMALQALTGALRQREVLERTDTEAAALVRTLALLRRDLESLVPVTFQPPRGGSEPALDIAAGGGRLALSLDGQPRLPDTPRTGLTRVIWQLDPVNGRLTRQAWPLLNPRDSASAGPEVVMLTGVRSLVLESSAMPPEAPDEGENETFPDATDLPRRMDLHLQTDRFGALRLVVTR